jgi:hypothetical protein
LTKNLKVEGVGLMGGQDGQEVSINVHVSNTPVARGKGVGLAKSGTGPLAAPLTLLIHSLLARAAHSSNQKLLTVKVRFSEPKF